MQKDKTDKSLVIDIQFFLKFGFVLLEGNKYCYTHTHTHTHTQNKTQKAHKKTEWSLSNTCRSKPTAVKGELKTMPITPGYFSCFMSL